MNVNSAYCSKRREVVLELGREYIVEPLNPLKRKHRGRLCFVDKLEADRDGNIWVRFVDKESRGKVYLSDLVPVDGNYEERTL